MLNTSSAFVAAFAAATTSENTSSFEPVPLAYDSKCGPRPDPVPSLPLVTDTCGVPVSSTDSLNLT